MIPGIFAGAMRQGSSGPVDPYWNDVVLCINGVGSIYDAKGNTIVNNGSVAIDNTDSDFPDGAIRIDTGKYLNIDLPAGDPRIPSFTFAGDVTIEFDYKSYSKVSTWPHPFGMYQSYGQSGTVGFYDRHASSATNFVCNISSIFPFIATPAPGDNVRNAWRLVRIGMGTNNVKLYKDDVLVGQGTFTSTIRPFNGIYMGRSGHDANTYINGLLGRIRITGAGRTDPQGTAPFPEAGP